ncbi:cobalt-precorrin 5B C1-methyltransferase [Melghirimyces profundicolus]|uniref:Cobalt-precorrin-5B C(1)-methyltransferase n=1 Tax=Melghirimyces profundicolus TaxID=1242148 RepID=A0A2T6C8G2_9BACL|nr:cobalt-precorrin-5B (C(1))-methyltransferase [Melghirimyces profundicolus]PTX64566.1 cobalt-precorrin 5B C1-methyltransferase [Melghirimyces profundicolus]
MDEEPQILDHASETRWVEVEVQGKIQRLRTGFTTGACAAAAAKGALLSLIRQCPVQRVDIPLPAGFRVSFPLKETGFDANQARCAVVKDGGDDPDATHGARIVATVTWRKSPGVGLDGGDGVGRVTKPGLSVPVGEAAINPVPRRMIRQAVNEVPGAELERRGVEVVISVPGGEEMAKQTLNGRLGIVGGISILGTTGIVRPYSTSAYRASVVQAVRVATANGCRELVLTTGGRSEKAAMRMYPHLPEEAFIEMADFLGDALGACRSRHGVDRINLVGMMGKFSKAARGNGNLHAHRVSVDFEFLADLAKKAGVAADEIRRIRKANTAHQVGTRMRLLGQRSFFELLCLSIVQKVRQKVGRPLTVEAVVITPEGEILGRRSIRNEEKKEGKG